MKEKEMEKETGGGKQHLHIHHGGKKTHVVHDGGHVHVHLNGMASDEKPGMGGSGNGPSFNHQAS
mgnify:CR=1 FL=1